MDPKMMTDEEYMSCLEKAGMHRCPVHIWRKVNERIEWSEKHGIVKMRDYNKCVGCGAIRQIPLGGLLPSTPF